jgi:phage tail sheath protein FI
VPEYLAPGVYVEETSFRAKSIEGVGTSTTAFVGPTRKGPIASATEPPELLTSFVDFERVYGGLADLRFGTADPGTDTIGFLAHAVRAYFNEGGSRLYVARVYTARSVPPAGGPPAVVDPVAQAAAGLAATANLATGAGNTLRFVARFPGACGNGVVRIREVEAPAPGAPAQGAAPVGSLIRTGAAATSQFWVKVDTGFQEIGAAGNVGTPVTELATTLTNPTVLTLSVWATDGDGAEMVADDLGYTPAHPRYVGDVLRGVPRRRAEQLENMYAIETAGINVFELRAGLTTAGTGGAEPRPETIGGATYLTLRTSGGNDGVAPIVGTDAATASNERGYALALGTLGRIDDISIVAAPGCTAYPTNTNDAITLALIAHAEGRRRYRIAVLDTEVGLTPGGARAARSRMDSHRAALYYPWVVIANPNARPGNDRVAKEIALPPSGFICGIYARNDIERGVFKAPANEVVRSALRFERDVSFGEQEMLNPLGVNCLRFFPGRGYRVWGARTASSDPEWKYVNIRRYFNYLEASIDRGTQWAVFEPNGERLWANVRTTVSDFLYNEWVTGALLGSRPEEAFFVRCDRSTMTQNDLDNGRLVCLIGVAALKPAEFVIFRIGQKTADARE